MRNSFLISFILISLLACESSRPGKELIPADKLVPILVDMHLGYSIQATPEFRELSRTVDTVDTYSYVFVKHDVTKVMFDSTLSWYSQHPKRFTTK
jgi:hypothetical protein